MTSAACRSLLRAFCGLLHPPFGQTRERRNGRSWTAASRALLGIFLATVPWREGVQAQAESAGSSPSALRFLRIGTGPTGGTYFPLGGVIANAISNPPGSRPCERGGRCGVPGVIAMAQATSGSVANIEAIAQGHEDLALAQADLVYWAYHGSGIYQGRGPIEALRGIAMLFQEKVHLVVRQGSGIHFPADLEGKRISLGEKGSGTVVDARLILDAYGVRPEDAILSYLRPGPAADALQRGELDAFFFVAAPPVAAVTGLAKDGELALVPLGGSATQHLVKRYPFLVQGAISAGLYPGVPKTPTLGVGALLICSRDLPDALAYAITESLFHATNRCSAAPIQPDGRSPPPRPRRASASHCIQGQNVITSTEA